jgi:hypothetical protein
MATVAFAAVCQQKELLLSEEEQQEKVGRQHAGGIV